MTASASRIAGATVLKSSSKEQAFPVLKQVSQARHPLIHHSSIKAGNIVTFLFGRMDKGIGHCEAVSVFTGTSRNYNNFFTHSAIPPNQLCFGNTTLFSVLSLSLPKIVSD